MSSREFTEWQLYAQHEPFGEERADYRAAIVAATIANTTRRRGQRPYRPEEFLPRFGPREREEQDWRHQLAVVELLNVALGGQDEREPRG